MGHSVDEARRVPGPTGNGQPFLHWSAPAPALGSQGRGIAQELTKGAFGWASPPKFKKRSKRLCHWTAVWPGQSEAGFSHLWVGNLFMFFLVVSCFLGKFFVKAPSQTWLIQEKRRFICTWVRKPECSRGRTGGTGQEPRQFWPASLAPVPSHFCSP